MGDRASARLAPRLPALLMGVLLDDPLKACVWLTYARRCSVRGTEPSVWPEPNHKLSANTGSIDLC